MWQSFLSIRISCCGNVASWCWTSKAKQLKQDHMDKKVKEHAIKANTHANIDFVATNMHKDERITQQNELSMFMLEDNEFSIALALLPGNGWRIQKFARFQKHIANKKAVAVKVASFPPPPFYGIVHSNDTHCSHLQPPTHHLQLYNNGIYGPKWWSSQQRWPHRCRYFRRQFVEEQHRQEEYTNYGDGFG